MSDSTPSYSIPEDARRPSVVAPHSGARHAASLIGGLLRALAAVRGGAEIAVVHRLLQDRAGLEAEHAATANDDLFSRLRVATLARAFLVHDEVAEAGDLHLAPLGQTALQHL